MIDPVDAPRFAALGVVASMQPFHANPFGETPDDGVWSRNLGAARLPHTFPWRLLEEARAPLLFGSDWPVMTADPLAGLAVAQTRRDAQGRPKLGWNAHQTISASAALSAYSGTPSAGGLPRNGRGLLAVGMPADVVVLAPDVAVDRPSDLWKGERVRVVLMDGVVRYLAATPGVER